MNKYLLALIVIGIMALIAAVRWVIYGIAIIFILHLIHNEFFSTPVTQTKHPSVQTCSVERTKNNENVNTYKILHCSKKG